MLKRKFRIRSKFEFKAVFAGGKSYPGKYVVIYVLKGPQKFAFIASKKVGNSVQRNRAKRLMREVIRIHFNEIQNNIQIIAIARSNLKGKGISYQEVEKSMLQLFKRAKVIY